MANKIERKLMADFPPVSTEQWEEAINRDLKGADYDKRLVWRTAEGFNLKPYYRAQDLKGIAHLKADVGEFPYVRSVGRCNDWMICQSVPAEDLIKANQIARTIIERGVEMVTFTGCSASTAEQLETLLEGIDIEKVALFFRGGKMGKIAELIIELADKRSVDPDRLMVSFGIDPLVARFSLNGNFGCSVDGSKMYDRVAALTEKGSKYMRLTYLNVGGDLIHNSGSTIVEELALSLAVGHEYLLKLLERGVSIERAASKIRFTMAVGPNYFMEIAKFRAARILWANIVKRYNPKCSSSMMMDIHAVTSKWNQTAYDPYVNMLRGTTEAMSAAIASVQSLEVTPFNLSYECPTEFSSRIARNVQLLLKHESHFDNVVDPAGGSYYIETLTDSIAKEAWGLFKEVEERAGYEEAFRTGFIQDRVESSAAKRDMNIATRREILLGTNQFPNFEEALSAEAIEGSHCCESVGGKEATCGCGGGDKPADSGVRTLKIYRGARAFEQMRSRTDKSEKRPKVFMLTCGTLPMARARSLFSSNFFGCAGFKIVDNNFFADLDLGVKKALASGAEIVVVCAADDDYATLAPRVLKGLAGKAITVVAGAPKSQPELEAAGVKNFISVKSNVLETLKQYQSELGI